MGPRTTASEGRRSTIECHYGVHAAVPSPDRPYETRQSYIIVSVLDERGAVVPGFETAKGLIRNDALGIPVLWDGKSARE